MENEKDGLEAIRKFTGDDNLQFVNLDDTFGFKCQQCGKCCMNRTDIILNPFDIYNGAKYLGISPAEFIDKYCFADLGGYSKIPIVLLATSENGFCPLLKFDIKDGGKFKCTIHPAKPGACANHPIGVAYSTKISNGDRTTNYIKVEQCPNSISDEQQVVKEWIKPYLDNQEEIDIAHDIQYLMTKYIEPRKYWLLLSLLRKMEQTEKYKDEISSFGAELIEYCMKYYLSIPIGIGYAEYDINKPFIEQAQENIKELEEFYNRTKILYDSLVLIFGKITGKSFEEEYKNYNNGGDVTDDSDN